MFLATSIEMESELKSLKIWSSMLNEAQLTTAINQLIQETTLAQVHFLLHSLKLRETRLSSSREMHSDSIKGSSSPEMPRDIENAQRHACSERSGASAGSRRSQNKKSFALLRESRRASSPSTIEEFESPRSTSSRASSSSTFTTQLTVYLEPPTPILPIKPMDRSTIMAPSHVPFPMPIAPLNIDLSTSLTKKEAKLNLIRLTYCLHHPLSPPNSNPIPKRPRKIPKFPIDGKNPAWLSKWLRSLRLHKYTENLGGLTPSELLELGEEEILRRGVDTLGARTKLLVALREAKESLSQKGRLHS